MRINYGEKHQRIPDEDDDPHFAQMLYTVACKLFEKALQKISKCGSELQFDFDRLIPT